MRRLPAVLVALTAAAVLALLASPASAAGARTFKTDPDTVRAGQTVKAYGKGCRSRGYVRIYLDGVEIDNDRADRAGVFVDYVEIPNSADPGEHTMKAGCNGFGLGSVKIIVRTSRFNVRPRNVEPGDSITVRGNLCKPGSFVTIKLDGELIGTDRANSAGNFIDRVEIPSDTTEEAHTVSARCHGKFVGSQLIDVEQSYPAPSNLLTTNRTTVPAGQAVTVRGTKCPTGQPTASLDGQQVDLAVNRGANGGGFTATATIPASATRAGTPSRWRWSRVRPPGPTGIRNGALLLVLVALAAVVALVDELPELGDGRRLPSIFQSLPPPTGITALPPAGAQPPPATAAGDARPATAARAHPNRRHPRPAGASEPFRGDVETRAARNRGGSGPGGPAAGGSGSPGGSPPPVTTTPVDGAAAASVRVPPVAVRVTPPALLGRDLPEVRVATPEVQLDTALP